jgi:hypothetical protein
MSEKTKALRRVFGRQRDKKQQKGEKGKGQAAP